MIAILVLAGCAATAAAPPATADLIVGRVALQHLAETRDEGVHMLSVHWTT